jgi:cold shock CspA family protein
MKNQEMPKSLPFQGGVINNAGVGRAAGSTSFLNHVTGQNVDLFKAQVAQVGPLFALAEVADNKALGKVRVDHSLLNGAGAAQLGDTLIVGPLQFLPAGPRAVCAWPTRAASPMRTAARPINPWSHHSIPATSQYHAPVPRRNKGTVTRVAQTGAFGQITDERDGQQYFVHSSQLQRGALLRLGARVSFMPAKTPRGLSAIEVQPGF